MPRPSPQELLEKIKGVLNEMLRIYGEEVKRTYVKVLRGERKVIRYRISDLGLTVDVEIRGDGEVLVHWSPLEKADMEIEAKISDLDKILTEKLSPMEALFGEKLKIRGSMRDLTKFLEFLPILQRAYKEGRNRLLSEVGLSMDEVLRILRSGTSGASL